MNWFQRIIFCDMNKLATNFIHFIHNEFWKGFWKKTLKNKNVIFLDLENSSAIFLFEEEMVLLRNFWKSKPDLILTLFSTLDCVILTPIFKMATNLTDFRSSCDINCLSTKDFVIYCCGWFAIIISGLVTTFFLGLALYNLFRKCVDFFSNFCV